MQSDSGGIGAVSHGISEIVAGVLVLVIVLVIAVFVRKLAKRRRAVKKGL
jgi:flagellar biosynthesis/type III secretory pathway M-ring protein FliF/YscJ